jgi:hypothetical protein
MSYLKFELNVPEEREAEYREFLRLNSLSIQRAAENLLRALQMMSPQDGNYYHGVVFTLARHVAEEVDAASILVKEGCAEPCKAHLRSAFEADLGIRYVLETDCEQRALAYHVKEARERLRANDKYDERTTAGQRIREAVKDDPLGTDVLASLPEYDFDTENAELRNMLGQPPYDVINAEWEARGKNAAWHALFGGPRTIRDLAYHLNRAVEPTSTGLRFNRIFAYSGVRSAFRLLQSKQASTQLCQRDSPPWARGMTWSSVNSSMPGCVPQYRHV